jgi:hypothetical protein
MFILKLYDREGTELQEGNYVKVSNGKGFKFISEVKYLEKEKAIAPFHTFSFHSFVKIDKLPGNVKLANENRYHIWYLENEEADEKASDFDKYLIDWRQCEHLLKESCYKIEKIFIQKTLF